MYTRNENHQNPTPQHGGHLAGAVLGIGRQETEPVAMAMSEVEREHGRLLGEIEGLSVTASILIQRLQPVIKAVPGSDPGKAQTDSSCHSQVGIGIREASERVSHIVYRLRELTESLAV